MIASVTLRSLANQIRLFVGFLDAIVGSPVGKLELPDMARASEINDVSTKCRVCQVSAAAERRQENEGCLNSMSSNPVVNW